MPVLHFHQLVLHIFFHSNFIDDLHWLRESRNHQYHHYHQIILDLAALYKFKVFWYTWLYNDVNDNNEILLPSVITELFGIKSFLQDIFCGIRLVSGRQCRSLERKIIFQFSVSHENLPWAQAEQRYTIQWFDFISHCIIELS